MSLELENSHKLERVTNTRDKIHWIPNLWIRYPHTNSFIKLCKLNSLGIELGISYKLKGGNDTKDKNYWLPNVQIKIFTHKFFYKKLRYRKTPQKLIN